MNLKLKLVARDRVGIVADISSILVQYDLNINLMEVIRKTDKGYIFVEIEDAEKLIENNKFYHVFSNIKDIQDIQKIEIMPQEEKAKGFKAVLDNISDGVLSIDKHGKVITINKVAARAFGIDPEDIVGQNMKVLNLPENKLLESLKGEKFENIKQNLITQTGRYQYMSTCKPIRESSGRIIGALEIAKDIFEIKKMAQSISKPNTVSFSDIIGKNPIIKETIIFAQKIALTDITVSVHGSSGTGKELFARAIHTSSGRQGPFVPINCAALPEQLLESELFGYEGGAFTGGRKEGKPGLFETAQNGTVFLDEIAEMPLGSQVKLLRLIQEKAVRRIGGSKEIPVNVRIITATNKNLEKRVENKKFRQDLYYRINILPIHIPPLSQRLDDIPLMVDHFLFQFTSKLDKKVPVISESALEKFRRHDWPGNIRELKNVVERAAILSDGRSIDMGHILFDHELTSDREPYFHHNAENTASLKDQIAHIEKEIIKKVYHREKTIRKTAKVLEISHPALIKKMRKYNIQKITTGN